MIVTIHQPAYLPWMGYFHRIASSDIFVVLDTTQFEKNSFINRNKIKTTNGPIWLTVPISTIGKFKNNLLTETKIAEDSWREKHWKSIELGYKKAPYFELYAEDIKKFYLRRWTTITELCYEMLIYFARTLGIKTKIVLASQLKNNFRHKTDLVIDICKETGGDTYISGKLGKDYIEEEKFKENAIQLFYQDYKPPVYTQKHGEFVPYMCILDLLFNEGPNSLNVILAGQQDFRNEINSGGKP